MSTKLVKTLEKNKDQRISGDEQFLGDVKLLMDNNVRAEKEILKEIGISREIDIAEDAMERQILNEKFSNEFEDNIFHIDDIEKLALKYKLYLRRASTYRGKIPADLGAILLNFKNKHNLNINNSNNSDRGRFFVLAPPKMFETYNTPKIKLQQFLDVQRDGINNFVKSFQDPMAFYRIDANHYKLLKAWGSDFTLWRRFLAIISKNRIRLSITSGLIMTVYITLSILFCINIANLAQIFSNEGNSFISVSLVIFDVLYSIFGICVLVYYIAFLTGNSNLKYSIADLSTERKWNRED